MNIQILFKSHYIDKQMNKNLIVFYVVLMFLCAITSSDKIMSADFLYQATPTQSTLWNNYVGVVFNYDEIENHLSNPLLKGYLLNSNINGKFESNWAPSIRMPKGYHYDCSVLTAKDPPV